MQEFQWLDQSAYAPNISRRDSTRSINGLMPSSLEMAKDSCSREVTFEGGHVRTLAIMGE